MSRLTHRCSRCGEVFPITATTRSKEMIFTNRGWRLPFADRVDRYFLVTCPKCSSQEFDNGIRMLGIFPRSVAKWAPFLALFVIIVALVILDRLNLLSQ